MGNLKDIIAQKRFDTRLANTPYSHAEHLADEMTLLSLYLIIAAACQANETDEGVTGRNFPGATMNTDDALAYLCNYPSKPPELEEEILAILSEAQTHIEKRVKAGGENAGLCLCRLKEVFSLDDYTYFCLLCAFCCEVDNGFAALFAAFQGDFPPLTLGCMHMLYCLKNPGFHVLESLKLFDNSSARVLFMFQNKGCSGLKASFALREEVSRFIRGVDIGESRLPDYLSIIAADAEENDGEILFSDDKLRLVGKVLSDKEKSRLPELVVLQGGEGSGRRFTLKKLANSEGRRFLVVNLMQVSDDRLEDVINILVFSFLSANCYPCFIGIEERYSGFVNLLERLRPWKLTVLVLAGSAMTNLSVTGYLTTRINYAEISIEQAVAFWGYFARRYLPEETVDVVKLAAKYRLTPGQIEILLQNAARAMRRSGERNTARAIDDAVLLCNTGKLNDIGTPVTMFHVWDDLILSDKSKRVLELVCNRVKYRYKVEKSWGFGGKSAYGKGISILLYGPPGTGKTMSAQVIAGELGLPLYRVNLAQIISKYIGETAKNLDAVFNEAKNCNVIIFFDEADALFTKRTDVKNSNDRHANSESSYLLQKIEEYSGISILSSNLVQNFDEAFRRRINYMVNISMPGPEQRLLMWENAIPKEAPTDPELDLKIFADSLEFSGSVIKSAVLQAAYLAAEEDSCISTRHIVQGVRLELLKLGRSEPHFMSIYPD